MVFSMPVHIEEASPITALRHDDGGYSLASGFPIETQWNIHVVGHYENREEAVEAIKEDTKAIAAAAKAEVESPPTIEEAEGDST